jgi:hypothetical protein
VSALEGISDKSLASSSGQLLTMAFDKACTHIKNHSWQAF